jgi:hypothetical protein
LSAGEIQDRLPRRTLSACASGQTPRIYAAARRSSSGGVGAISLQRALIAMASRIRRRNSSSEKERFQRPVSQSSTKCARRRSASARHLRETSSRCAQRACGMAAPNPMANTELRLDRRGSITRRQRTMIGRTVRARNTHRISGAQVFALPWQNGDSTQGAIKTDPPGRGNPGGSL